MAIKLHFTNDEFNVFENRGRVKGTRDTFNARNDRYIFEKLATKYPTDKEIIQFSFLTLHTMLILQFMKVRKQKIIWLSGLNENKVLPKFSSMILRR